MTRIFVIFNPAARGEKSQRLRQFLESKRSDRVTLAPTRRPGDATRLAAAAGDHDIVVAAGGDGTINEVVNGLNGAALGVLPLGTVNVFARELGIPRRLPAAWELIESGRTRAIDLPYAEAAGQRRWFCQLAGVGFDARAVRAASWELKKKIGPLSYVWAGLKTMRAPGVIEFDGARGVALLIGNGRFYGGRYRLFPEAKLDDGLLDACFFERVSLLRYGPAILLGRHTRLAGVRYVQGKEFCCASAAPFQLDGEDAGDGPVKFSLKPRALRVIAPPGGNRA